MALATSITIQGTRTGGAAGSEKIGPILLENADAPDTHNTQAFVAATFAALTPPALIGSAAVQGVVVVPPSANTGTITQKGATGDTGVPLHKTKPSVISLDAGAVIGFTCSANTTLTLIWF